MTGVALEVTNRDVDLLATLAAKLKPSRNDRAIINDLFEAADDWKNYVELMIEKPPDAGCDLSGRQEQEEELFDDLLAFYGEELRENPDFAAIMDIGGKLLAAGARRKPNPDGVLRSNKIVRETFKFLETEFGYTPVVDPRGASWGYASKRITVEIDWPRRDSGCQIVRASPQRTFSYGLEDLLFLHGKSVALALPPGQKITKAAAVQAWFSIVANILRTDGADVLADKPGAFGRLVKAANERERLYIEECERLYPEEAARWAAANKAAG